jgi:hypothetical protein
MCVEITLVRCKSLLSKKLVWGFFKQSNMKKRILVTSGNEKERRFQNLPKCAKYFLGGPLHINL